MNNDYEVPAYIVLLSNPAMPDVLRLHVDDDNDPVEAVMRINSERIPARYEVLHVGRFSDARVAADNFYCQFPNHVADRRLEFYVLNPELAVRALQLTQIDDHTEEIRQRLQIRDRRPPFPDFDKLRRRIHRADGPATGESQ